MMKEYREEKSRLGAVCAARKYFPGPSEPSKFSYRLLNWAPRLSIRSLAKEHVFEHVYAICEDFPRPSESSAEGVFTLRLVLINIFPHNRS